MFSSTKSNGNSRLFKGVRNAPRGFNFTPRYYDPAKEELNKRIEVIEKEVELAEQRGETYRITDREQIGGNRYRTSQRKAQRTRLLRLIMILGVVLLAFSALWDKLLSSGYLS